MVVAAVAVAAVFCGVAIAAVTLPFSGDGNTINACYSAKGTVKLLTPSEPTCSKAYTPIHWNVTGPPGQPGSNGVSPTVTQLAPGDSHCPAGGAAITDAANTTAYVCSGTPFSGTFTAGSYSIGVTSSGITLAGPGQKITLNTSGITIEGSPNLDVKANGGMTVESVGTMALKGDTTVNLSGVSTTVEGASLLHLSAPLTRIGGGSSCTPIARVGDSITGTAPPFGGTVTGTIVSGDPTLLGC